MWNEASRHARRKQKRDNFVNSPKNRETSELASVKKTTVSDVIIASRDLIECVAEEVIERDKIRRERERDRARRRNIERAAPEKK